MTERRSEPGLDVYRGISVILMFAVHARRIERPVRPPAGVTALLDTALDGLIWLEPYIAASFLFLVGYGLVLSFARAGQDGASFIDRMLKRAAALFGLSILLFVPQYGLELPDLVVSSGVLSAIAAAIACVALAVQSRNCSTWLAIELVLVLSVTALLDGTGATVPGLNAGPGGAVPLIAFTALGALAGAAQRRGGVRALAQFSGAFIAPSLIALASGLPWTTERSSHYSHEGPTAIADVVRGLPGTSTKVVFWNHSAVGAIGLFAPLCASALVMIAARQFWMNTPAVRPLIVLGRHALLAYVVHLGLLGLADLTGIVPPNAVFTWLTIAGLVVVSSGLAVLLERRVESANRAEGEGASQSVR